VIEKHITSLEMSKRLEKAGVRKESEWVWTGLMTDVKNKWIAVLKLRNELPAFSSFVSAYSISELLEMLSNEDIEIYLVKIDGAFIDPKKLFDIFRSPDALSEVVLFSLKNKEEV